jgi:hypothetical protein
MAGYDDYLDQSLQDQLMGNNAMLHDPSMAPPNSEWDDSANSGQGGWKTKAPGSEGYDKTWGGYTTGDPNGSSTGDQWLKTVYDKQGWDLPTAAAPGPAATPPPTTPSGGGGNGAGNPGSGGGVVTTGGSPGGYNGGVTKVGNVTTPTIPNTVTNNVATSGVKSILDIPEFSQYLKQLIANQQQEAETRAKQAAGDEAYRGNVRSRLLSNIDEYSKPVDDNDPTLAGMNQAWQGQAQRGLAQGREALAARAAATGMPTGAIDSAVQGSYENLAKGGADYKANLKYTELNNRRANLAQSLQMGAGVLNQQEQTDLQRQIAEMDTQLKDMGLNAGSFLQGRQTDVSEGLGLGNQNLSLFNSLTGNQQFYDNLAGVNQRFYDQLGSDNGWREALLNSQIMQELMGAGAAA